MKTIFLLIALFALTSCAVVTVPLKVVGTATEATIRTAERTAELGLEILDEPFDEEEGNNRRLEKRIEALENASRP